MIFNLLKTSLGQLRIIGFLEGLSYILLLGIAMPLKYYFGMPEAVRGIGMIHGVLFIAYVAYCLIEKNRQNWPLNTTLIALVASLVPFGTFYADAKIFKASKAS